jgi:hypothetical protein
MPLDRAPTTGTAKLIVDGYGQKWLRIKANTQKGTVTLYKVLHLPDPHHDIGTPPAIRLMKPNGDFHDIHHGHDQWSCTCEDFVYCRQNQPVPCKHINALRSVGLLDQGDHE